MSLISDVIQSTVAVIKGMKRTISEIPREKWTVQYPDVPITVQPRYRGQHLLHVDEMGKEKCVACYLCAAACPSDCIYIEAENDPRPYEERIGRDERYAKVYNIDYGRCIFCGFCVEACPKDAITHGYNFELSVYNRADLLKTKDDLLITRQKQSKNYRVALSSEDVDSEYKEVLGFRISDLESQHVDQDLEDRLLRRLEIPKIRNPKSEFPNPNGSSSKRERTASRSQSPGPA